MENYVFVLITPVCPGLKRAKAPISDCTSVLVHWIAPRVQLSFFTVATSAEWQLFQPRLLNN